MAEKHVIIVSIIIVLVIVYMVMMDPLHLIPLKPSKTELPTRNPGTPLQFRERFPSSGVAWSKKIYPDEYSESNKKISAFYGIDDFKNERFLDIGGRAYSREFLENFSYTESGKTPDLHVEYLAKAEAFTGRVVGSGLKPNFAYQIKLRGVWKDRPAFEKIGYTGRWRLPGRGTNYTDKDYEESDEKHLTEAYILFDYAVTDPAGNIDKEFYLDSSLHVLWNLTEQRIPRSADTSPVLFPREGGDRRLYAHPRADLSPHLLFAESQQNWGGENIRNPMGQALLPPGPYTAEVVLTEESFHGYGDSGFWATVMAADVEFEIIDKPRPPIPPTRLPSEVLIANLPLSQAEVADMAVAKQTETDLEGKTTDGWACISLPESVSLPADKRLLFTADIYCEGEQAWWLYVSENPVDFDRNPARIIRSTGPNDWHPFEVEITSIAAGRTCFFGIVPATRHGKVGVRNVSIRVLEDAPLTP